MIKRVARLTALLVALAAVIWAILLLTIGLSGISFQEVRPGESPLPGQITHSPYIGAIYSLLALTLIVLGLLRDKWLSVAWLGVVLHILIGGLLLWGMGILYVALAGVLAFLLGILQWQVSRQSQWRLAAWAGAALVLLVGGFLSGTASGPYVLALGFLLCLVLLGLQRYISRRLLA